MAYYAWSPIKYGVEKDKDGNVTSDKVLAAGESVSQKSLGVSDEDWEALIAAGSVREYAYPDMPETFQGSPVDFLRQQAQAVAEAVDGSGGGYFGPTPEEAMMNPELVGILDSDEEEEVADTKEAKES